MVRTRPEQAVPTAQTLATQGWRISSVQDSEIIMPAYDDDHVARLVATLVTAGASIYRVELRRRSLEQIFLDITEQAPPQGQPSTQQQPPRGAPHQPAHVRQAPVQRQNTPSQAPAPGYPGAQGPLPGYSDIQGPHRAPAQPAPTYTQAAYQAPAQQAAYQGMRRVGA